MQTHAHRRRCQSSMTCGILAAAAQLPSRRMLPVARLCSAVCPSAITHFQCDFAVSCMPQTALAQACTLSNQDLSAEPLCLPAELTLRETVMFQYPLLRQHSHSGGPLWNSQSAAPQTYTQIVPWPDLHKGGHELVNSLDNIQRSYAEPSCCVQPDDSCEGAPSQIEVRGNVMRVMDIVNEVLKQLGSAVKCSGGGDGRSMSYADLIIRLRSAQSSLTDMSGQVLGTVLVKSDADFTLMPGESLQEAMKDPLRGGAIKAAVQEVRAKAKPWHSMFLCKLAIAICLYCQERSALHLSLCLAQVWVHGLRGCCCTFSRRS